nr:MAG TPA: hypothetical protein [Caudoviricetes sp.]
MHPARKFFSPGDFGPPGTRPVGPRPTPACPVRPGQNGQICPI